MSIKVDTLTPMTLTVQYRQRKGGKRMSRAACTVIKVNHTNPRRALREIVALLKTSQKM